MNSLGPSLDAKDVHALFGELSDTLGANGTRAQLFVVGGAAMALVYDHSRTTRDVDALFVPTPEVRRAAEKVGAAHGLEPDWLNDAVKGFLPGDDAHPLTVFESESLIVQVPSPQYLLAMKLYAARDARDFDDAAKLFNRLGFSTEKHCVDLLSATYPTSQLLPRHRYVIEDIIARADTLRAAQRKASLTRRRQARHSAAEQSDPLRRADRPTRDDPPSGPGPLGL